MSKLRDKKWKKRGNSNKGQNGITLIALVITIIVLLILAGVSIMMLTGDNSILKNATDAKSLTEISQVDEAVNLAIAGAISSEPLGDITDENIKKTLAENMPTGVDYTVTGDKTIGWTVTVPSIDKIYAISSTGTVAEKELATLESISQTELTIDGGYYLQATVSSGTTEDLIWSSDNTNVATVTSEGIVKCGTETGECTITVKGAGGTTKECKVTSTAKIVDAKSGNRTVNGQAGTYNNPTVPDGFMAIDTEYAKWSTSGTQTDVNKGLVIMDNKGNEFVWIPVQTAVASTESEGTTNKAMAIKSGDNYRGLLYDFTNSSGTLSSTVQSECTTTTSSSREPDTVSNFDNNSTYLSIITSILTDQIDKYSSIDAFKTTMQEDYNSMITSVNSYGGFYIGRYESSLINDKTRVVAGATSMTADSSSANAWYGLYARQKKFANDNSLASVGSSMVWGSQWDAMLNWMIERNIDVTSTTPTTPEETTTSGNTNRTTGTISTDKINNIYDILGNSYEWTLEAYDTTIRVLKGGSYAGSYSPSRRNYSYPFNTHTYRSSRPTLYVK